MLLQTFTLNELGTNTYVLGEQGGPALLIDPSAFDMAPVFDFVRAHNLTVERIVNTHCHYDHVLGNESARQDLRAPLSAHRLELPVLRGAAARIEQWYGVRMALRDPDEYLADGDAMAVGPFRLHVLETPGHTPGGICLYEASAGILFSGDTLFAGTVGRTDLPGSSGPQLMESLAKKLWPLPDDTRIFPGHADDTTIAEERMHNPYFHF